MRQSKRPRIAPFGPAWERSMIVDAYLEQYAFSCRRCGYEWSNTYRVRRVEDEQGGAWDYYSVGGVPATSPAGGVRCPSCGGSSVAYRLADRRHITIDETGQPSPADGAPSEATVPAEQDATRASRSPGRIVVAIDGTARGIQALRWAASQARLAGATLEVAASWDLEVGFGFTGVGALQRERDALRRAEDVVAEALGTSPEVPVSIVVHRSGSGEVLVDATEGADLLVIGAHARHRLIDALVGSVTEYCIHHAHCPVVVVPDGLDDREDEHG